MGTMFTKVRNGLLAASMMAALGFGAVQAFASPAEAQRDPTCSPGQCNKQCQAQFGPFAHGFCEMGVCNCAV
ncbi:MAG TPA: hypothetical protein VF746_26545 [Longimicrobium sp.]